MISRCRLLLAGGALLLAACAFLAWYQADAMDSPVGGDAPAAATGTSGTHGGAADTARLDSVESSQPRLHEPDRVEALAPGELRVRVVDAARRPLMDVPVALAGTDEIELHRGRVVRSTNPDGIARFPREGSPQSRTDGFVYLALPGAEAQRLRVDLADPPKNPVELVAPDLGRLVVKVHDAQGRPVAAKGDLELFAWPATTSPPADMRTASYPFLLPLTAPGELVIDPIATGLQLSVAAWLEEHAVGTVEGAGPARAAETVTLAIRIPRFGPVVTGRLVAAGGTPMPLARLSGVVVAESEPGPPEVAVAFTTDAAGGFRFDASGLEIEDPNRRQRLEIVGARDGGIAGRAHVALPVPFVAGEYAVGDVAYEAAPFLVSGHVVDAEGNPVADARVCVSRTFAAANDGSRRSAADDVCCSPKDAHGTFEAYGFLASQSLVAFASHPGKGESEPVRFVPGTRDMTLVVRGTGAIEGSIVHDPSLDHSLLSLALRHADRGGSRSGHLYASIAPTPAGTYRWGRVAAGTVDVVVRFGRDADQAEAVLVVPAVEVRAGETSRDPRLVGIDLRSRLAKLRVEVVDPEGVPVRQGTVALLSAAEPHERVYAIPLRGGVAELPTMRATVDVDLSAPGFLSERCVAAPARIVLRRAAPVVLALDPPLEPEHAATGVTIALVLSATPQAGTDESGSQRVVLDKNGSASFLSTDRGTLRVFLELRRATPDRPGTDVAIRADERWEAACRRLATAFGEPTIVVAAASGAQRLLVPLPPAARTILIEMLHEFRAEK